LIIQEGHEGHKFLTGRQYLEAVANTESPEYTVPTEKIRECDALTLFSVGSVRSGLSVFAHRLEILASCEDFLVLFLLANLIPN
jgi:hypothetical protein